jgi:hypothetical protein
MANKGIYSFSGLVTASGTPAAETARLTKNFVRHRHRGWLEQMDGYGRKFPNDTDGGYPQITQAGGTNYLDPAVHKISLLTPVDIHNFHVAEHDGADVALFAATYRKTSRYDTDVAVDRLGLWIRPYWNGSAWIDAWRELTEMQIVHLTSLSDTSTLNFADTGFANDYFKGWTLVFEDYTQAQDTDNYFLITGSTGTSVTYFGDNSKIARAANARMNLIRTFLNDEVL